MGRLSSTRQFKLAGERQVEQALLGEAAQGFAKAFGIGSQLLDILAYVGTQGYEASEVDLPANMVSEQAPILVEARRSCVRRWQMTGLGPASCCDLLDVVGPTLQRGTHIVGVFGSLINSSYPRAMSAVVVQDRLDVVRLDA